MKALGLLARSFVPLVLALPIAWMLQVGIGDTSYAAIVLMMAGINVILAVSLNVVNGFTGQFSIGHAGFMAVGAYTATKIVLATRGVQLLGLPPGISEQLLFFLGLVAGMITAAIAGLVVGLPSLRLRGDYLAIVTLGFNGIIGVIIENTDALGRSTGISGLPRLTTFTWVAMGAVVTVLVAKRLAESTHGRAMLAIREDEVAAEAMGVDTTGYKVRAFVIASAFAGLAGGMLVHLIQLCTPRSFTFIKSIEVVVMVVLGGMGSVTGSVLAALLLTLALEALREIQQYRMVGYAVLLIALMLLRPTGLFGTREIWDLLPGLFGRRRRTPAGGTP